MPRYKTYYVGEPVADEDTSTPSGVPHSAYKPNAEFVVVNGKVYEVQFEMTVSYNAKRLAKAIAAASAQP